MNNAIVSALMFGLAIIGLLGFTLVPYRSYQFSHLLIQKPLKPLYLLIAPVTGFLLYAWSVAYFKVIFKCLAEAVCGANRAQGILILALFGFIVLVYELLRLMAIYLYRRKKYLTHHSSGTPNGAP
jgi:hypothetical protein